MKTPIPEQQKRDLNATDDVALRDTILHYLKFSCATSLDKATTEDLSRAVSLGVRELLIDALLKTNEKYNKQQAKRLYYLSMEFLIGRSLGNTLINLGIFDQLRDTLLSIGVDLEEIGEYEQDAALGNGGLGRLAACFLDSIASLGMPGFGYGLNYEFGLFRQEFSNGYQVEKPVRWDTVQSPWLIARPGEIFRIPVYGRIEHARDLRKHYSPVWVDQKFIIGVPHDMPIVGFGGKTVNYLRLFSAQASDEFDTRILDDNDYFQAVRQKITSESVSKVLYPSDSDIQSRELRLLQEYFLVACSVQDIIRAYRKTHSDFKAFPDKIAIQLNDTNPALTVAELMRCLVDEYGLHWLDAWDITRMTCSYTNHTLLPEALEKWSVNLFEKILPRHLQIIFEINHRFLEEVRIRFPDDENAPTRMSLIEEAGGKQIDMAHLAIVGSHSVNGVANQHSRLLRNVLFPDFAKMWPEKFNNKTNGITQRRWLLKANPHLSSLLSQTIGSDWITNLDLLKKLEDFAGNSSFQIEFQTARNNNKRQLAAIILATTGIQVNPQSLFDVQIKRIHEYKRQLLHVLHIIHLYRAIIEDGEWSQVPRTHIFAGKAAPGYTMAKLIIKLINNVASIINADARVKDYLKVVMLPDFGVSLAEKIIPAADLSEQISTAGMEASGTGNMKLALNGALTIGTQDGATIEIMEEVGRNNIFMFGLNADEIDEMRTENSYNPLDYYANNPAIRRVVDCIDSDMFCQEDPGLFREIFISLMYQGDYYFHLADLQSYIDTQALVSALYSQPSLWREKSLLNIARIGKFSSDRTIRQYAEEIWHLKSVD